MTIKARIEVIDETGSKFLSVEFHHGSDKPANQITEADALRLLASQANPRAVLLQAAGQIAAERKLMLPLGREIVIPTTEEDLLLPVAELASQ